MGGTYTRTQVVDNFDTGMKITTTVTFVDATLAPDADGKLAVPRPKVVSKGTWTTGSVTYSTQSALGGYGIQIRKTSSSSSILGSYYAYNTYSSYVNKNTNVTLDAGTASILVSAGNLFGSNNRTERTVTVTPFIDANMKFTDGSYSSSFHDTYEGLQSITLNAPPTVSVGTPTYSEPHYAGLGEYSVTVTQAQAKYSGYVQTITLTIGSDSVTQNYGSSTTVTNQTLSLTPTVAGTYTPTITVTDTRGQSTTVNLEQITVNAYTAPNISFDLQRTNGSGIPNAEGEHGLVTASISYTDAIAELTQPTVAVRNEGGNLVASSATWYETWDTTNGVDDAVNWTDYNPQSPATLYAVVSATGSSFSPNESYTVSITPTDNQGGTAQTITQTLSTGFFTIDFKAGGKEIAFGAPANDDVTNYPEGLFKCAMSFKLKDNLFWVGTRSEYEQAVEDDKMPEHTIVFITDETADYVVEEGTSGVWTYRKWASGVSECWCITSPTSIATTAWASWGNIYEAKITDVIDYPTNLFTSFPTVLASATPRSTAGVMGIETSATGSASHTPYFYALRPNKPSATMTVSASIHAIGTWK